MPKELININRFDKGLMTSVNPIDLDINAMSYSENLDANQNGKLQGIPQNTVKSSVYGLGYKRGGWLKRYTGEYDLFYSNGTDTKVIQDFYGTPVESTVLTGIDGKAFVKDGLHFLIGNGDDSSHPTKWVGSADHQIYGGIENIVFTSVGGGTNEMVAFGDYTGTSNATYKILISATAPDYFTWNKNGGTMSSPIAIPFASYEYITIELGVQIYFNSNTGHGLGDYWTFSTIQRVSNTLVEYNAQVSTYDGNGTVSGTFQLFRLNAGSGVYLHRYRYSLVYDGTTESPLSTNYMDVLSSSNTIFTDGISIIIYNGTSSSLSIDSRLTSVNLYVAISVDATAENLGLSKLLASTLLESAVPNATTTNFNPENVIVLSGISYINYINTGTDLAWTPNPTFTSLAPGLTYEQNTGIPENNEAVILNYTLAAQINGYNIVGDCYSNSLTDAKFRLFRSKQGNYNSFDIVNDNIWMNIIPIAMKAFNGKLYVWDESHTYVVDPDGLFIQDIIPGIGCSNDRSCEVIEVEEAHTLIFSDANNIYMSTGSGIIPIGDVIKIKAESASISWQSLVTNNAVIIYDAILQLVLILISKVASTDTQVFAYHIIRKRWDYFPDFAAASTFITGALTGINGESYAATSVDLYENFNGTNNRAWVYIGSEMNLGSAEQPKKFYNFKTDEAGTGTLTPYFSIDKGTSYITLTNVYQIKDLVSLDYEKANSIRLKLTGAIGSVCVNAIELLFRKMVGVR